MLAFHLGVTRCVDVRLATRVVSGDLADAIEEEKAKLADYTGLMKTKREDEVLLKSAARALGAKQCSASSGYA